MAWSLLIQGGTLVDGSGAPREQADLAVEGDRIAAIAPRLEGPAARVIDATGHVVAPGFIDAHSHSDLFYFGCPSAESKIRQGCTTEVVGMCSFSQAPIGPGRADLVRDWAGGIGASVDFRWETFPEYLDALRARKPSINVAQFVGHGHSIRRRRTGEPSSDGTICADGAPARQTLDAARILHEPSTRPAPTARRRS
jgi:N-acyl-D-amino-acid deacylase